MINCMNIRIKSLIDNKMEELLDPRIDEIINAVINQDLD
jgi:hypothetical protein